MMQKHESRTWVLRMRAVDRRIFDAVKSGMKSLETRALNDPKGPRCYGNIAQGDAILFLCGKKRVQKHVGRVWRYRSIAALLQAQHFKRIAPWAKTRVDAAAMYSNFPGYAERIKKYGIICFELK